MKLGGFFFWNNRETAKLTKKRQGGEQLKNGEGEINKTLLKDVTQVFKK